MPAGLIAPAVALVAAALVAPSGPGPVVIDRTLSCEPGVSGGLPKVTVWGYSAIRRGPQPHEASVELRTQIVPAWRLAGISESWLMISPACKTTRARVPLNARGLQGGVASSFGESTGCLTTRRVLVHVHATFSTAASLRPGSLEGGIAGPVRMLVARGKVTAGSLAVRTTKGRPLAFAAVKSTGKARIFTRGSCG